MSEVFDPWKTETGFHTNYEGVVGEAFFQPGDYGWQIVIKILTDDPDHAEVTEFYGLGNGWYSSDGGQTAEHPDMAQNPRKNFHRNSGYGKLIDKAAGLMQDAGVDPRELGDPRKADVWLRTSWFMEEVENRFKDRATGEERVTTKNYPSKFLGIADGTGSAATSSATTTKPSTSSAAGQSPANVPVDNATRMKLTLLAKKSPSHGEWLEGILDKHPALFDDEAISGWLAEESTFTSLKG